MHRFCRTSDKVIVLTEGESKALWFSLHHTTQREGHGTETQGSHKKAKAKTGDLRLHYPVSNSSLSSCGNVIAEAERGTGAWTSISALKRVVKSVL